MTRPDMGLCAVPASAPRTRACGKRCAAVSLMAFITVACFQLALPVHAAELGRLFFTPEERARFEVQGAAKEEISVQNDTLSVDGMIQKGDGQRIIWINGKPQAADKARNGESATVSVTPPGQANSVRLKVGERIELGAPAPRE